MATVDNLTRKIIALLRRDARMTYKEIAARLGKPESTVRDRVRRLEQTGVIKGYTVVVNRQSIGLGTHALVMADVGYDRLDEVTRRLLEMPNVLQLYHISGEKRLAFVLAAQSLEDLQKTLAEEVADLGFKDEEVVILMKNLRELGSNLEF